MPRKKTPPPRGRRPRKETPPPRIIDEFGSLIASLVARYLDSRTAVRLLRKTAKRCSPPGALRLWTFDCYNEQQANELVSKVDRTAVIVVRVHWNANPISFDLPPPVDIAYEWSTGPEYCVTMPDGYFRHCESICLVGFPRNDVDAHVNVSTTVGLSSIHFNPRGNALTVRDGLAAVFARAPAAAQGAAEEPTTGAGGEQGRLLACLLSDGCL